MILQPGILALLASSSLMAVMMLVSAGQGAVILHRWHLASGSELQLALERRTYLISTITGFFLAFQLSSLFLFISTADSICNLFVGAMCAVGTLTANGLGYPTLLLKVTSCVLSGLWLIVNHADKQGYDYPLIRSKYRLLLVMAPLILAETVAQALYFAGLRPDIVTSCCGTLFSQGSHSVTADIVALPAAAVEIVFYLCMVATLATGVRFLVSGRGAFLYAFLSGLALAVCMVSIISFISLYIYEMPSHHCPFCLLQKDYGYVGYLLYLALFAGTVAGLGAGMLERFRNIGSLVKVIPKMQKKLVLLSAASFSVFTAVVAVRTLYSSLRIYG